MGWHCPVSGCDVSQERNPNKLSSFGIPSDIKRRMRWKQILKCDFKGSVRVCERHFSQADILREYSIKHESGKVILHGQFKKVHLKPGAFPIPPSSENERPKDGMINREVEILDSVMLEDPESKIREFHEREHESVNSGDNMEKCLKEKTISTNTKNLSCTGPGAEPKINREHSSNLSCTPDANKDNGAHIDMDNVKEKDPVLIDDNSEILNTPKKHIESLPKMFFDEIRPEDNAQLLENVDVGSSEEAYCTFSHDEQGNPYAVMRKNIMQGVVTVTLPDSQSWAIVRNEKSDSLLFMYGEVLEPIHAQNTQTLSTKIVALTKTKVVTWFRNKNIKLNCDEKPGTLKELEYILKLIHSYTICSGGPPTSFASNATLKAAYKDETVWRHNDCHLVLQEGKTCINCIRIHRLLSEYLRRRSENNISSRFANLTPRTRRGVSKLKGKIKERTKIIRKKEKKILDLFEELDDSFNKLKQIEENKVDKLLDTVKGEKISPNQRIVVKEIINLSKSKQVTGRRYSPEWLLNCLLLYIKSPAAYNLLRKQQILPLPCKSTISKYLKNSNVGVGFDDNFFSLFAKKLDDVSQNNPRARYGILSFDVIQVKKALNVNVESMTFSGLINFGSNTNPGSTAVQNNNNLENDEDPSNDLKEQVKFLKDKRADHALVFMFSSLGDTFHQPIGTFASLNATKSCELAQLILSAIIAVEKSRGKVMALVCDGAKPNRAVWKEFGINGQINVANSSFINPYEEAKNRKIYVFSDAPHLIKCIRNNLFSRKFLKINGEYVRWEYYEKLYKVDEEQLLRMCPKLTSHHIKPVNMLKMRVFLATQIFSNSVADGLTHLSKDPKHSALFEGCEATTKFTKNINDMFDLLNISNPHQLSAHSSPNARQKRAEFFQGITKFIEWLNTWECEINEELKRITVEQGKALAAEPQNKTKIEAIYRGMKLNVDRQFLTRTTAEGLRVTLISTAELSRYLLDSCDFKFVFTRKFNQDCLEKFFGTVRLAGRQNDHPTLPTFMQVYHLLSVYQILRPPKFGNCEIDESSIEKKPKLTFDDFKKAFDGTKAKSPRQIQLSILEKKLEECVEDGIWDSADIELDEKLMSSDLKKKIMNYVVGFMCKKMRKMSAPCPECEKAFESQDSNAFLSLEIFIIK